MTMKTNGPCSDHKALLLTPLIRVVLAAASLLVLASGSANCTAAEAQPEPSAKPQPAPRLTERDYLLEELKVAEEQLELEEKRGEIGKGVTERLLSAKRSLIALRRQLAAYDERTKRPTPEQEAERKRRAEEQKRASEEQEQRAADLKKELLPVLMDIAQQDRDARVRQSAIGSISRLRMDSSIEPLSQVVLKDTDLNVRLLALSVIGEFRTEQGLETLIKLYNQLPDSETALKQNLIGQLQVMEKRYTDSDSFQMQQVVPTNVVPKLAEIVNASPVRDLRRAALQQLGAVSGEPTTDVLIGIYEKCGDNEFKQTIVQFLGGRGDPQAMRKLLEIAKSDSDPRSRQMAVELLGGMPFGQNQPRPPRPPMPGRTFPGAIPPVPR